MQHDRCFQLGRFSKRIGNDGRLLLDIDADDPANYKNMESVFVEIDKKLVPFFVTAFRMQGIHAAHVMLEDIDTIEQADFLVGNDVYLSLENLPALSGNKFYYHEVIGFIVFDLHSNQPAGEITDVLDNGPNDLFKLKGITGEVLIPVADDWIVSVDRITRTITMDLPEGLLEINAGKNKPE